MKRWALVSLLVTAAAQAQPATQPAAPAKDKTKEAQEQFELGQKLYTARDYENAVVAFQRAYALSQLPALLFNIGQAYRLEGDCDRALDYYQGYLEKQPDALNRADAEARVAEMKKCQADRRHQQQLQAEQQRVVVEEEPPPEHPGRTERIAGLVTAGLGVVLVTAGVYSGIKARDKADEVTRGCANGCDWVFFEAADGEGQTASDHMLIFTGIGAAAVIGGAVLYYVGWRQQQDAELSLVPIPGGAGVSFACDF